MIASEQGKFCAKFDVIGFIFDVRGFMFDVFGFMFDAIGFMFDVFWFTFDVRGFMFDVFGFMFDVIVNEVKKYSTNATKFEAKVGWLFEKRDVITICRSNINAKKLCMPSGLTCKNQSTSTWAQARKASSETRQTFRRSSYP